MTSGTRRTPRRSRGSAPPRASSSGAHNFRDLGGYIGHDGRAVRWRTAVPLRRPRAAVGRRPGGCCSTSCGSWRSSTCAATARASAAAASRWRAPRAAPPGADLRRDPTHHRAGRRRLHDVGALYTRMIEGSSDRFVAALRLVAAPSGPACSTAPPARTAPACWPRCCSACSASSETDILADYARSGRSMVRMREGWAAPPGQGPGRGPAVHASPTRKSGPVGRRAVVRQPARRWRPRWRGWTGATARSPAGPTTTASGPLRLEAPAVTPPRTRRPAESRDLAAANVPGEVPY